MMPKSIEGRVQCPLCALDCEDSQLWLRDVSHATVVIVLHGWLTSMNRNHLQLEGCRILRKTQAPTSQDTDNLFCELCMTHHQDWDPLEHVKLFHGLDLPRVQPYDETPTGNCPDCPREYTRYVSSRYVLFML